MQKFIIAIIFFLTTNLYSQVSQNDNYQFYTDLKKAENNQLEIELITPLITTETAEYKIPSMVPGTYKIYDFGRFVMNFKAFDKSGNELPVINKDINTWEISGADKLYKITYKVDDTFGDTTGASIFEPVGTSIDKDEIFVLNNHGFFGYFSNYQSNDYILNFKKPKGFYGATSLINELRSEDEDIFKASDYNFLVDNPIMYNIPDTTSIKYDEMDVMISVYSPGKGITSKDITIELKKVLDAMRKFLGGKFSADRYTFLYYFSNKKGGSGMFGALEHNYSSFYYMPDVPASASSYMVNQLMSTSVHEFYHTVTPLNLHAEEIGNFDFNDPKMSKHLWLYEGVTEYNADFIQLWDNLIDLKDYAGIIKSKINGSASYNDTLPFTVMSKGALDVHESQYANVYQKGALIGLCLDILIREESNGSQSLQDVINTLISKYGKDKSFKDDELFDEITLMTSPKIGEFFDKYVSGPNSIPYEQFISKIGFSLTKKPYEKIDMGGLAMGFNDETFRLVVVKVEDPDNPFVKDLGIKMNDELVSINGNEINFQNARDLFGSAKRSVKMGDRFELVVARKDESGKENNVTLVAIVTLTKTSYYNDVKVNEDLTDKQKSLKDSWLGK